MASCGMRNSPRRSVRRPARCSSAGRPANGVSLGHGPVSLAGSARRASVRLTPGIRRHSAALEPTRERSSATACPVRRDAPAPPAQPVTVTVARTVRPDQQEAFELWAENVLGVAAGFPGNLGATLLRPGPDSSEYHLVYRFSDDESLAAWERSSERPVGAGAC